MTRLSSICGLAAVVFILNAPALSAAEVTAERLNNAAKEPQNWLSYGGTYSAWRYSALDQVNRSNVRKLTPAWAFSTGVSDGGLQATPIVADGYTQGNISWPQGTVSDRKGNIWLANCGNDSVTVFPAGDSNRAFNIALGPTPEPGKPQMKPFGATIDLDGNVWIGNNRSQQPSRGEKTKRNLPCDGRFNRRTPQSGPIVASDPSNSELP